MRPAEAFLALVVLTTHTATTQAQSRWVVLNGDRLTDPQIAQLDRVQCTRIPDGAYWLDARTGAWGYAGNPQVQGRLGELCGAGDGGTNADGTIGPFVTMRRAEQEANNYRKRGLRAVAFHNGLGYFVRVSR